MNTPDGVRLPNFDNMTFRLLLPEKAVFSANLHSIESIIVLLGFKKLIIDNSFLVPPDAEHYLFDVYFSFCHEKW